MRQASRPNKSNETKSKTTWGEPNISGNRTQSNNTPNAFNTTKTNTTMYKLCFSKYLSKSTHRTYHPGKRNKQRRRRRYNTKNRNDRNKRSIPKQYNSIKYRSKQFILQQLCHYLL